MDFLDQLSETSDKDINQYVSAKDPLGLAGMITDEVEGNGYLEDETGGQDVEIKVEAESSNDDYIDMWGGYWDNNPYALPSYYEVPQCRNPHQDWMDNHDTNNFEQEAGVSQSPWSEENKSYDINENSSNISDMQIWQHGIPSTWSRNYDPRFTQDFPDPDPVSGGFKNGPWYGEWVYDVIYNEANYRLQGVANNEKVKNAMLGPHIKGSIFNAQGEIGYKGENYSIALKSVVDIGTVKLKAGLQYKDGIGLAGDAKAAVASGRATLDIEIYGHEIELGVSGDAIAFGGNAMYGYFANEGFKAQTNAASLFGGGFIFRVKPEQ